MATVLEGLEACSVERVRRNGSDYGPLGHCLLPCGEETEQDTGPLVGQGPRGCLSHLALQHPHHLGESNSADKVLCLPLTP